MMRKQILFYLTFLLLLVLACRLAAPDQPAALGSLPTRLATAVPLTPVAETPTPVAETPTLIAARDHVDVTLAPPTDAPATLPVPSATATRAVWSIGAAPGVPAELVAAAQELAAAHPAQFTWTDGEEAAVRLVVAEGEPLAQWTYVVAAPFSTVIDEVSLVALREAWQGSGEIRLLLSTEMAGALISSWGAPAAELIPSDDLVGALWERRPAWTVLPFHRLTPELKLLSLDGYRPGRPGMDAASYPLTVSIGLVGDSAAVQTFRALWSGPVANRDEARLTRVAMTGVTALVRATAYQMELRGIHYPGEEVAPVLQGADIAHVSNEVSFSPDCPYPNPIGDTSFCSRDSYFSLLEMLGVDLIELTGNHLNDKGTANLLHSLDMYDTAGMRYFGGGREREEAGRPAVFEHNGNRIAFVGCNPVGPAYAWATDTGPGSMPCDYDSLYARIQQLRAAGHVVIATLQYWEHYEYLATAQQQADFRALAAAGAAAVSGSQGHHAQGFAFHEGAFIHYGLGNLFFDQMDMMGTRQTFIDTYLIYDGRLLGVELWTGLIENYARPRLMTPAEREQFLRTIFTSSGW